MIGFNFLKLKKTPTNQQKSKPKKIPKQQKFTIPPKNKTRSPLRAKLDVKNL